MYKSFPFYSSHSLSAELEVGICYLELPLNQVDPDGIHASESRWRAGGSANLSVGCQVLNNGAPLHAVEAETSGHASYDAQRVAFFYGEALGLPARVRDLSRDSLLVFTVRNEDGALVAAASQPLFDGKGVFCGGLRKLALHDEDGVAGAELEAARAAAEVGGRLGAFHGELRGDAEAEQGYKRYVPHDHLFRAEVFREGFGGAHESILEEQEDWLDDLTQERIGEQRKQLNDRETWLRAPHCHADERAMADRAFLCVELPRFDHPVLWEERPYGPPPVAPDVDAALARLVADAARLEDGDDAAKLDEALAQAGLDGDNEGVIIYDFDDDEAQAARGRPAEEKYRALARDATRALVDKELRPDVEEGRALKRVMSAPGDSLASADLELLWKFRHALTGEKRALPKFLLAVDWRDATEVSQVPALLDEWRRKAPIDVADAIKLLGPDQAYQRSVVRAFAVDALRAASDTELVTYLLQLVQALRYDEKDEKGRSPLASFLSERAAKSVAVANFVWWYLKVGAEDATDEQTCATYRVCRGRFAEDLAERAPEVYATLRAQEELVVGVLEAQAKAKDERGRAPQKQKRLRACLGALRTPALVAARGVPCPIDPAVMIGGLHAPATAPTMFKSALTPSLVGFTVRRPPTRAAPAAPATPPPPPPRRRASSTDGSFFDALRGAAFGDKAPAPPPPASGDKAPKPYRVIVKHGDDLRQDQLVLQFVLLMDLLLKRVNLDLRLTCYGALATGAASGIVEFVEESKAISEILADNQGSILNYLRTSNPDVDAPGGVRADAIDAFTKSCAGYCVITYLLGVGDRHLDNIMVRKNGQLFHIDFGFILGRSATRRLYFERDAVARRHRR